MTTRNTMATPDPATFVITVTGESDDYRETIRGIRDLLKRLGRSHRLRCDSITPLQTAQNAPEAEKRVN